MEGSESGVLQFMVPAWIAWIVAGLVLNSVVTCKQCLPKFIIDIMEYGKLRRKKTSSSLLSWLSVPKRWFTHFYVWGTFWIFCTSSFYFRSCFFTHTVHIPYLDDLIVMATGRFIPKKCRMVLMLTQQHIDVAVVLNILSVQVLRRLYERLFVSAVSNARMHVLHYVLGMFFYPAAAFTALLHLNSPQKEGSSSDVASLLRWYHVVAYALFLWASYHQHMCHRILARIRTEKKEKRDGEGGSGYGQPDGDWFEYVSCPHFLAEILIYVAMLLCFVVTDIWSLWWLVMVYLLSTLGLSARQTHAYYLQKYEDYPKNRYAIIPWIC